MKPWFIQEDNVIPFPKKDTSVVRLPNVNAYPDFLTGVQDLQNHLKQGDISSDIHKKLYQDLIHRFMKVESFETPWFLRESPAGIMSLTKQIQNLPPDTDPRIIAKINDYIELAMKKSQGDGSINNVYTSVSDPLKKINDADLQKYRGMVAKLMIGNGLTGDERNKIIQAMDENKCINIAELKKENNLLSNICAYFKDSLETQKYYMDMLMFQPGQRIGPGEILFATHSKDLIKGTKGDLTVINTGQEIEVKGGKTAGRFRDQDIMPKGGIYEKLATQFIQRYSDPQKPIIKKTAVGISFSQLIDGVNNNPTLKTKILKDIQTVLNSLWPNSPYVNEIVKNINSGNEKGALYNQGLANLKAYYSAKQGVGDVMGVLFIKPGQNDARTNYAETFEALINIFDIKVTSAYPIASDTPEAFPKIEVTAKNK
jgi:hypothetical protein